jgi:uncharacterized protein YjbI with pentapeptide repeats
MDKLELFLKKPDTICSHISFFPINSCQRLRLPSDEYCILHSKNPNKDRAYFNLAIKDKLGEKDYDFSNVFFPSSMSFVDLNFESAVVFSGAIFSGGVYFQRTKFNGPGNFARATFGSVAIFTGAIFQEANFESSIFEFGAFFNKVTFISKTSFKFVKFYGRAIFTDAQFQGGVFFDESNFKQLVLFDNAIFLEKSLFWKVNFYNVASFLKVIFSEVWFDLAKFSSGVSFTWTKFEKSSYFSGAIFKFNASFEFATFGIDTMFDGVYFFEKAAFSGISINGRMNFYLVNPSKIHGEPKKFQADMTHMRIDKQAVIRFQDLCLSNVEFSGTDLFRPEFRNVTWNSYHSRQIVYDEALLNEKESNLFTKIYYFLRNKSYGPSRNEYARVEELYRYLKLNYEREGDHKQAGDFHFGEMEMHRRASKWRWFPFYWYNLYRFLSGYGERPIWALCWLALFLSVIAWLVCWLGLEIVNTQRLADFGDSFIYLLQKVTLQRPTWAEPVGFWGKLVAGLSVLVIPGQAALFLLALRNRLGRRR